jgi:mandelate racemase
VDWADAVLQQELMVKDGHILVSDAPGNGIAWDESAVAKYLAA